MDLKRYTGQQAGSHKYDLLTALAIAGLNNGSGFQTSMLRLIAVVTARYNWRLDEFSVGQRDLARIWSVDERTVKREIKRLTDARVLIQLRPGVRGRVAAYRLNQAIIFELTAPYWHQVGPDFAVRMSTVSETEEANERVVKIDFGKRTSSSEATSWERVQQRLKELDPGLHRSWFASLDFDRFADGILSLNAPSAFIAQYVSSHHLERLRDAVRLELPSLRRIHIAVRR
jgi:DNA-binding transcriptional MocR family regulator